MKKLNVLIVAAAAAVSSNAVMAEGIDITTATAQLSSGQTAMAAVGGVMIGMAGVAVSFKWVKAAIFG